MIIHTAWMHRSPCEKLRGSPTKFIQTAPKPEPLLTSSQGANTSNFVFIWGEILHSRCFFPNVMIPPLWFVATISGMFWEVSWWFLKKKLLSIFNTQKQPRCFSPMNLFFTHLDVLHTIPSGNIDEFFCCRFSSKLSGFPKTLTSFNEF